MIVSIDPGSAATGVALFTGPAPAVTVIKRATAADALSLLSWTKARGAKVVLVEDQHVPRDPKKFNWPAIQTLMLAAHRFVVVAELLELRCVRVKPSEWQGPMFKAVPKTRDGKKLTTKQRAKLVAEKAWETVTRFDGLPVEPNVRRVPASALTKDQADAAVMGRWWQLLGSKR